MPCRINLRHDQHSSQIPTSQADGVTIYAPEWVQKGLETLARTLNGVTFQVHDNNLAQSKSNAVSILESFTFSGEKSITLVQLEKIARNEERNTTGMITKLYYHPDINDDKVIYALKDLVRQCVIIGLDETTHFGGYPSSSKRIRQKCPVYIVDLAGLQFQQPWNTGRLVLYSKSNKHVGLLDDLIFENVVGESRRSSYEDIENELIQLTGSEKEAFESRFIKFGRETYFDAFAYKRFVARDFILCVLGLCQTLTKENHTRESVPEIHFKFLKYGAGYFARDYSTLIQAHILDGVIDGLEELFEKYLSRLQTIDGRLKINSFEFPFYALNSKEAKARLDELCKKYFIQYKFSRDDALEMTAPNRDNYIIATTNCADPHAVTGNEMGFGSVDSVIAENLKSKGNIFSSCLNHKVQSEFIKM